MSIFIPGMKMPKDGPIAIWVWPDGRVHPNGFYRTEDWTDKKAVEIKTPHGRLVDAGIFGEQLMELAISTESQSQKWLILFVVGMLNKAPTIIEAEGGGEDG